MTAPRPSVCRKFVSWWGGEYEGECELSEGHAGDHWDGLSWYNEDGDCTDQEHVDLAEHTPRGEQS